MIRKLTKNDDALLKKNFGIDYSYPLLNVNLSSVCINDIDGTIESIIVITNEKNSFFEECEFDVFKIAYIYNKNIDCSLLKRCFVSIINRTKRLSYFWASTTISTICQNLCLTEYKDNEDNFYYHSTLNNEKYNIKSY